MKKFNKNKGYGRTKKDDCEYLEDNGNLLQPLSEDEISSLLFMIEEEKMARDIYDELFEQTDVIQFDRISDSEQKHYNKLLTTATKFDVDVTNLSTEVGVFSNLEIQSMYDTLIAQGSNSEEEAIAVGIIVEETDIADLYETIDTLDNVLLEQAYSQLLNASIHHLDAFENIA